MKFIYVVTYYLLLEQHHIEVYFNKKKAFRGIKSWLEKHEYQGTATIAIERILK